LDQYTLFNQAPQEGKTTIYRSSAGSGKTFTLTKAYLKLVLLDPSRYTEVLAITFTNDAKNEMKTRILSEITQIADGLPSDMRQAINADFEAEGIQNIKEVMTGRAKIVLDHLLHDYTRFHVSTIDHFFAQLIRHLARELKINLGYELDIDVETALTESIKGLFRSANQEVLEWLTNFAIAQIDNEKGWNIQQGIKELGFKLFQESYLDIKAQLDAGSQDLGNFIKAQQKIIADTKLLLKNVGSESMQALSQNNLITDDLKGKSRGPIGLLAKLADDTYDIKKAPTQTFQNAMTVESWYIKSSDKISQIEKAYQDGISEAHALVCDFYDGEHFKSYLEADAILKYIYAYGVLSALGKEVQKYRSEHNLLLISDTAMILNEVIDEQEMPFIYEKIGSKFKYVLIDEFQDTSKYQWNSLLPFLKNAVDQGGQLIVVGDVKQSIYGWRGGDMNLLLHQIEEDLPTTSDSIKQLDTNYRSARNVIQFNNHLFTLAPVHTARALELMPYLPELEKAYEDVNQKSIKDFDGYVRVQFLENQEDNSAQEQALEHAINSIKSSIEDGFAWSDILILTRKNSEAQLLAKRMIQEQIPTISDEALSVDSSEKVKLLLSAFKFLQNPEDAIAIAEFNYFINHREVSQFDQLGQPSLILQELASLSNKPVYELAEEIIIKLNLSHHPDIYLQRFLDICLSQGKQGREDLNAFLQWWDKMKARRQPSELAIGLPTNNNAVRLMTIHKAKGLEKPVVIIPFADMSMPPKTNSIFWPTPLPEDYQNWGSLPLPYVNQLSETSFREVFELELLKQALESLNLMYVAFTRAAERLIIFCNKNSNKNYTGALLASIFSDVEFSLGKHYSEHEGLFVMGEATTKREHPSQVDLHIELQNTLPASPLSRHILIDEQPSKLFMAFRNEKSEKIREGLLVHLALSQIESAKDIPVIIKRLQFEQALDHKTTHLIQTKINDLFAKIPEMGEWFDGSWQVINERKIYTEGDTYIPDRVMFKDKQAVIVDYKKEKHAKKHIDQITGYSSLITKMGYSVIGKYLVYADDAELIEVN
jgi:ATP-dependent helicase/nuclease subunit A